MMSFIRNLFNYRRAAQPSFEESQKYWLDEELKKIERSLGSIIETYNPSYIGSFASTEDQSHTTINTPKAVDFNVVEYEFGVYQGTPTTRIYFDNPGYYNLEFTAQLLKTSGANAADARIWIRYNGEDLPNSALTVHVQGPGAAAVAAWNYTGQAQNSGDYVELMWLVTETSLELHETPAGSNYPATSSVRMTITQIAK
jgi:hypothetical protein